MVLKVCPAPRPQALRRWRHWPDSSIHERLVKASSLVDQMHFKFVDISYSGSVNFLRSEGPQGVRGWRDWPDSSIHERLVKASSLVDQMHFKFVDISYSGSVNFLLHKAYTPDAIVV